MSHSHPKVKCVLVYPDDSEAAFENICFKFASLSTTQYGAYKIKPGIVSVRYLAPTTLDDNKVLFYARFLSRLLPGKWFTWDIGAGAVTWHFEFAALPNQIKRLLYLVAFRYVDEYPSIIDDLYIRKGQDDESLFAAFQRIHVEYAEDSRMVGAGVGLAHALIYPNGYHPISISQFHANVNDNTLRNVNEHFKAHRPL